MEKKQREHQPSQACPLGSGTRKLQSCTPQGATQGRETHAQSRWADIGKALACQSHLRTVMGGQKERGPCKHANVWEYRIPSAKTSALWGSCCAWLMALGVSCFAAAGVSSTATSPADPPCSGRMDAAGHTS
uniref:Uncharacterized protein n=1 Tax=Myotis myotis TaxID=51298 RepID=A0A7J7Z5I8_MYOMY|nr:hypothetical protein mMyoMyo1_010783 [Myotis myotis]